MSISSAPHALPRSQWLILLRAALSVQAWDFVRQAADAYLRTVPHDMEVELLQAQALLEMGDRATAFKIASTLALADPENAAAHALRLRALPSSAAEKSRVEIAGALTALGRPPKEPTPPAWGTSLHEVYAAFRKRDLEAAQAALFPALPGNGHIPILAVAHLRLVWMQGDWAATLHLARTYHERWPEVLAFRLVLAHQLAESGQEAESVAMLHAAAADDPAGQVLKRLFGEKHPYRALWPQGLAAPLGIPLPASVAAALGQNRLPRAHESKSAASSPKARSETKATAEKSPSQQPRSAPTHPSKTNAAVEEDKGESPPAPQRSSEAAPASETGLPRRQPRKGNASGPKRTTRAAERVLSQTARRLKVAHLASAEGRFPVYVIFSTRSGLAKHYGRETTDIILRHMHSLAAAVGTSPEWEALVLIADDAASARTHGVKPVPSTDPWALKKQLADLDAALKHKGSMIGALLIVGGPEVVPFHHLPNPLEDEDDFVPSDNPYGAIDENYLAPTWPVGRLPGGADGDATLLLSTLRRLAADHRSRHQPTRWHRRWWETLRSWLLFWRKKRLSSMGYTAAVWEKSARTVFKEIGSGRDILTSPPLHAEALGTLPPVQLAYFNLHGLADAAPWYGQRDPANTPADAPDYPVALRPDDIHPQSRGPKVVFSEACHGAYLEGKTPQTAMCLRFLYAGSHAFVGSTVTAYGSVAPPLSAADLLGALFWQRLKLGIPVGEALRQAKYLYARQMHQRLGFLDGEDQKTLISFVLYGDPLYQPFKARQRLDKGVLRPKESLKVATAEEHPANNHASLPPRMSKRIKGLVETYLPGGEGLNMRLAEATVSTKAKGKGAGSQRLACKVIVVSKQMPTGAITHRHFMRVAIDTHGKVFKITVSR